MTNGRFHPPKLQKMGVLYTHSPKRPSPFLKLLKNRKKRKEKRGGGLSNKARRRPATGGQLLVTSLPCPTTSSRRPLVARVPTTSGWWLVARSRPVADQQSLITSRGGQGRPTTSSRPPTAVGCPNVILCTKKKSLLPLTFCTCGQLLLVGSSTCPPYLDFSEELQTPITFDL
jgi:hypothetical protein